jgi:3-oxoacyl-[acyl-carrier-protein] synthase II
MADKRRVVITGIGAVTPLGVGAQQLNDRWTSGIVGIQDGVGRCLEFVPTEHLSVKENRRLDRFAQFAVVAADEAIAQAGWSKDELPYDSLRVGTVLATGIGGMGTFEDNHDMLRDKGRTSPLGIPMLMPNAGAAAISMRYGLQGSSFTAASACSSGGHGIGMATRMIQYGDVDAVVAGGAEATATEFGIAAFQNMGALADDGVSRPFDRNRSGFVLGEGAGVLVLEAEETALARGATILGEIAGFGSTSDASHLTAPDPTGIPASSAIKFAVADAGLAPEQISYVNAHGTSTELNDASETAALKAALGDHAYKIPVSSLKSSIGHLLGAAGAVEAVATVQSLNGRVAPPTLNYETPDPECDLDYVPNTARELTVVAEGAPAAVSTSFAFGGHNVAVVIKGQG